MTTGRGNGRDDEDDVPGAHDQLAGQTPEPARGHAGRRAQRNVASPTASWLPTSWPTEFVPTRW